MALQKKTLILSLITSAVIPLSALAEDVGQIATFSLSELTNIQVTSVSKKSETASEAAAAIFVITQNDIRRMGATSIPEALRMVPGVQVAQSASGQWAITSRGFNDQFANKLLVLIDGRSVYNSIFSGVFWDLQDYLLEDIDRIEIIRGPGATLWGANAVNGVINIITKKTKDTQGTYLTAGAGNNERGFAGGRYGGEIGTAGHYRGYVKYNNRDESRALNGAGSHDEWDMMQAGFRSDFSSDNSDDFTVQGDIYKRNLDQALNFPTLAAPFFNPITGEDETTGLNFLTRWDHKLSNDSGFSLQVYLDHVKRTNPGLNTQVDTLDVDFQHSFVASESHEVIWGAGYRLIKDQLDGTYHLSFTPDERSVNLFSAFIQDKITLIPESVFFTLGSKFEHNDYTGFEFQPSARISWLVDDNQTVWASVSRALRSPNRASSDIMLAAVPQPGMGFVGLAGNPDAESEDLIAYELGYRVQPTENMSLDFAGFYNDYDKLYTNQIGTPFVDASFGLPPHLFFPLIPVNESRGTSYGIEIAANLDVTDYWRLTSSYSWMELRLKNADITTGFTFAGKSPEQQLNLRSSLTLPYDIEMDNMLYYMDSLQGIGVGDYWRFDTRIGWKPVDGVELSIVGQNLLDSQHPEFSPFLYNNPSQIGRSVYGQVTLRF